MTKKLLTLIVILTSGVTLKAQNSCDTAPLITEGIHVIQQFHDVSTLTPNYCLSTAYVTKWAWYKYQTNTIKEITISTVLPENMGIDTRLMVYTSNNCQTFTCHVSNDDFAGAGFNSQVTFIAYPNTEYYIVFDNRYLNQNTSHSFSIHQSSTDVGIQFNPITVDLNSTYRICAVDINNDGLDDLVGINNNSLNLVLQNQDQTFTYQTIQLPNNITRMPSWSMAAGDYNRDGILDFVLGATTGVTILTSQDGNLQYTVSNRTESIFSQRNHFIDINNDGHLDIFVCHDVAPNVYFLNNETNQLTFHQGGLGDVSNGGNYGSIWVDINNDNRPDLFIAKCRGDQSNAKINQLFVNNGQGSFTDISASANMNQPNQTWSSAWGDFDNDGYMDAFIGISSTSDGSHLLMHNNGNETFTDITANMFGNTTTTIANIGTSQEYVAHDFDNDGFIDILVGNRKILKNLGNNTFKINTISALNGPIGDFNNDGFLDIQNDNRLYLNTPNNNHWIKFKLTGVQSNTSAIGTRIEIYNQDPTGNWQKQIRDVRSGDGFENMSTLTAHFGLGTYQAQTAIIKWPSGTVDILQNPNSNTLHTLVEGATLSVETTPKMDDLKIVPNPANQYTQLVSNLINLDRAQVLIYDVTGKQIQAQTLQNNTLNTSNLSPGTYILKIQTTDGKAYSRSLIKK